MAKDIEAYLNELKAISDKLSKEEIKLEEAVALYKEGAQIAEQAEKMLAKFQNEIEVILKEESEN